MPLLSADALNDFFEPSQDCIKPVEVKSTAADSAIRIDGAGVHWEVAKDGTETQLEKAQISLNDCLACSGCVTTAETVLIGLQSWQEVASTLSSATKKLVIASICPQSVASVAASYDLSFASTFRRLRRVLRQRGFVDLISTNIGRDVCLDAAAKEFLVSWRAAREGRANYNEEGAGSCRRKPLLASACPGWICYAEKQKSGVIPNISRVRSPQQMTGVMLKDILSAKSSLSRGEIYHVAIMPCFDKKLEASRGEFTVDGVRDVDTVVTGAEVVQMLRDEGIDLRTIDEDGTPSSIALPVEPGRVPGSSSGGYLAHVLASAAVELFNIEIDPSDLRASPHVVIRDNRTPKLREYDVVDAAGSVLLRFAEAYGFRQITSLAQKLSPATTARAGVVRRRPGAAEAAQNYDYVEVMACDRGCINGGGQVKPIDQIPSTSPQPVSTSKALATAWTDRVEGIYLEEFPTTSHDIPQRAQAITAYWRTQASLTGNLHDKLTTTYNAVPPMVNPLASKW
ncbi:Cytosolic Fe-S cluster assembly factor nar1 [Savitreella phatthalungensis]